MKRFFFQSALFLSLFALGTFIYSCQKESPVNVAKDFSSVTDRSPNGIIYGITVYDGVNPSDIVAIDQNTGLVLGTTQAFTIDAGGNQVQLDNLKGICLANGAAYFVTTGGPVNPIISPANPFNNALFRLDPQTGQCFFVSTSTVGTVSDLEFNPADNNFYGLLNNSNNIVQITTNGFGQYSVYNGPFPINFFSPTPGYVFKGLSLADGNGGGFIMSACATTANINDDAFLYDVPLAGGGATFMTALGPATELGAGHCAIGYDRDLANILVNRSDQVPAVALGLNRFPWVLPFGPATGTGLWGGVGFNYEDLTSSVY